MTKPWDLTIRLLHWAIALTVTFQQLTPIWMSDPGSQFLFPYHRIVGAVVALLLFFFWLYQYAFYDLKVLFPWGKESRKVVLKETLGLFKLKLPRSGHQVGLSSFVHGLGLLALTGCAVTGMIMFSMIPPGSSGPADDPIAFTRYTLQHKFFGEMLWYYWIGHVAFAVIHQFAGDNVFGAMFGRGSQADSDQSH